MKRITLFFALLLTTATMMAEEFSIGLLTYRTTSDCEVAVVKADKSIISPDLNDTITYQDVSYSVTSIGDYAFQNCSSLTSVTIPESVTSIGYSAFNGCTSLTSVTIPESVTSIGLGAMFQNCTSLKSVQWNAIHCKIDKNQDGTYYVPFGLKSIEKFVFGNNVTFIPECLCSGLSGVTSINIPNSVTSIGDYAFKNCSSLTSVNIPNSVTSLGTGAFRDCSSLTSITIPESVTSIGLGATFQNCTSLKSVQWNAIHCKIDKNQDGSYYPPFHNLKSIEKFVFGNNITFIPECLCYGLSGVTSITIPNSVTSIGWGAFNGCSSLTSVTIPNSVTEIGDEAFLGCSSLTSATLPTYTKLGGGAFPEHTKVFKVTQSFYIGRYEYTVIAPNEVSVACCNPNIVDANIHPEVFYFDTFYSVTKIADSAFEGCSSLIFVTIPDGVTSIGEGAFNGCSSLKSITIPNSVTSIGECAFYGCSDLTSVEIPESVKSIGDCAFARCKKLNSVTISYGVQEIGDGAFAGCKKLKEVTIPCSVRSVGANDFHKNTRVILESAMLYL